jgi:hypothetical protein
VPLFVLAGLFLAAIRRAPGWRARTWAMRGTMVLVLVFAVLDIVTQESGLGGLSSG